MPRKEHKQMKASRWILGSIVATCSMSSIAPAQPSATDTELQQYASMYWHLIDTGTPHPDAYSFQFADSAMNQPGAYPFAGALLLFNNIYASKINNDATQCEGYGDVIDLISENAEVAAKFRVYTMSKEFTTSFADPVVNEKHLLVVINALGEGNDYALDGEVGVFGADLVSIGLKLASGAGIAKAAPSFVIPENATFEEALVAAVEAIHISDSPMLVDPIALIRGTQPVLTATTELASLLQGAADSFTADPVFVACGNFAMISLVRVDYGEKVYIADASVGMVFGPYERAPELPVKDVLVGPSDSLLRRNASCGDFCKIFRSVHPTSTGGYTSKHNSLADGPADSVAKHARFGPWPNRYNTWLVAKPIAARGMARCLGLSYY